MKVVVTGASGHVGANLVRELLRQGRDIKPLLHQDGRAFEGLNLELLKGDVLAPESLVDAFRGAEVVYHLAAKISITGDKDGSVHNINVHGARNVVSACLKCGVRRLVHFSSVHAFSQQPLHGKLDETRNLVEGKKSPAYDRSKADGIREVRRGIEKGLDAVIVCPTAVLGPCDFKPSRMGRVLLRLYHRKLPALVNGGFDWVDARDVSRGALAAEQRGRTGEMHLLSGHWLSMRQLASVVGEVTGVQPPRLTSPMWLACVGAPFAELFAKISSEEPLFTREALTALRANRQISHEKATRELDYRPRPFRETIADTFAWFKTAGHLTQ